jgi:hypothetical protein
MVYLLVKLIIYARILKHQKFHHRNYLFLFELFLFHSISNNRNKRFAVPFPDMNRFLSTSHKLHGHHHHHPTTKSGSEIGTKKHDFHAYLCRYS